MNRTSAWLRLRPAGALAAVLALAGAGSCPPRTPPPAAAACAPVTGELAAGARAEALAGQFRLTLISTRGPRTGQSAAGTLRLQEFGARSAPVPPAAGVRTPVFGGTDVDLAAVGAVALGDVQQSDPARPGVLVLEWPRPNAPAGTNVITLRLGADANRGGDQRFDGTYMALSVAAISASGFGGGWESGAGQPQSAGYFCAERTAP
jgi:hypothetical protein